MIELKNVTKTFKQLNNDVKAVHNVSLTIEDGDIYGIIGLSGAGKSTLVRCINCLERPTSGNVLIDGVDMATLSPANLREKRHTVSMIFQSYNLFSQRTVLKNVCYPLEITGVPRSKAVKKAKKLLDLVELSGKENAYPSQLSGGQKQRVAIARALATNPKVLLCDEATSALDPSTTESILSLLKVINETMGVTIVVITHEMKIVQQICNKVAVLDKGRIVEEGYVKDVFLSPKSDIAKGLILPDVHSVNQIKSGKKVRIILDGRSAYEPFISNLTLECHTAVNIISSDIKTDDGIVNGSMVIELPKDEDRQMRVFTYLNSKNVPYKEECENA